MEQTEAGRMAEPGSPDAPPDGGAHLAHDGMPQLDPSAVAAGVENLTLEGGAAAAWPADNGGPAAHTLADLEAELQRKEQQISKLAGTLAHWRAWAVKVAARYSSYSPDVARPARRIYVGGLPSTTAEGDLRQFLNDLMNQTGGSIGPGSPVVSCKLYAEKNYAFVEFRTVEEASNCMALDGVLFMNCHLRVRRPNNYLTDVAQVLGPDTPDPSMDLDSLGLVKTVVPDTAHKLFIGGLPCDWDEEQVKTLLTPFGRLKAFNLVMDKNTGNSKGYAFAEMQDQELTDVVVHNLHSKPVGNKFLTVKRALAPAHY